LRTAADHLFSIEVYIEQKGENFREIGPSTEVLPALPERGCLTEASAVARSIGRAARGAWKQYRKRQIASGVGVVPSTGTVQQPRAAPLTEQPLG